MVKNALKIFLINISIASFVSCSTSPTYSRQDIEKVIKNICKDEFNLDVLVWEKGQTIWMYAPLEKILSADGQLDEDFLTNMRRVYLSLKRVILSMSNPPTFYCLVFSDITAGYDIYYVGFIPDMVKFDMGLISFEERDQRVVAFDLSNPQAVGDKLGTHIPKYDLTLGEFISYLIKQNIQRKFMNPDLKDNFEIHDLRTYYYGGKLGVIFNIEIKKYIRNWPDPFEEAKKITKKLLATYDSLEDIEEIQIIDSLNNRSRFYTKRALLEE